MGENSESIIVVEALYSFKGKNNDELCFMKGDLITITQREEGGWWEGTLADKTGWFPSNYVREYKPQEGAPLSPQRVEEELLSPQHCQQQQVYRSLVLKDILDSERAHLADLQSLIASHLGSLRKSDVLTEAEYKQMVGNLEEVAVAHSNLVTALEEQSERPSREQRIGGAFLTLAPHIQNVHQTYCTNHPRAVCMLEKYKDELSTFMESQGAPRPGIMFLTTALSKPFRRLDKYTGMLQEYQRHLEEGHPDRGDTQRSSHVYKELASVCGALRRQKELELEVVTGRVHGWEGGESLGALGEVLRMGSVALLPDHRDRYFVLFPAMLVMLSVSPRMSAFIFEGSYPLSGISVNWLEDGDHHKNAFELSGPVLERIVAVCQTRQDQQQWVEALTQQCRLARASSFTPHKSLLTSPPVLPAHVSVWPKAHLQPASSPCMSCGLPYYCGGGVQKPSCSCSVPCSFVLPSSPTPPYLSLPYMVLTKHLASLYRKKIITKKLLRHLAGDREDVEAARHVRLRKHRTECSIHTGGESSSESEDDTLQHHQQSGNPQPCSDSGDSSDSSSGYWVGGGPIPGGMNQGFNVFSPMPSRKLYHPPAPSQVSSNLHKWRFQTSPVPNSLSTSEESGASSESSNPYGYIRYFNSDKPSSPPQDEEDLYRRFTYTQPSQVRPAVTHGEKSSSCNDFYNMSEDPWATPGLTSWGHHRQEHLLQQESVDTQNYFPKEPNRKVTELKVPRIIVSGQPNRNLSSLTVSKSHPTLTPQLSEEDEGFAQVPRRAKTVHSSVLTIPAAPMMLAGLVHPQRTSDCESSQSSPNVCNKTIYEPSSSSYEGIDPEKVPWIDEKLEKRVFPFRTKPDIAYYVSSCSGDETGEDAADYYESHRRPEPLYLALSRSEPNLCLSSTQQCETKNKSPKYSSHYVQLVLPLQSPATKVCNCEAHSHRSSDSGLADVVHHLECCPLRTDTPGLGRGSGISHSSQSSQVSSGKFLQGPSWYPIRAFTPDSLLPTPVTSPNTSAPVSYAEDSLTSLMDSVSLHQSSGEQETSAEEGVYRSGLYAHWWMKASVCPRLLVLDRSKKDYLRFRGEKKPDIPPKPRFLKPSYHVRRGGNIGGLMKPVARCASTQTCPSSPTEDYQCVPPKLKKPTSHLSPQTSLTMSRDRSFESQVSQLSQVTVVPKLRRERESQAGSRARSGVHTLQILGKNSQESSGTDLSSLHSFSESCEGAGQQPHLRDSCEGLDVDFQRRASSHSLHTTNTSSSASSAPYKSTLYWHMPPAHGCDGQQQFDSLPSQGSKGVTFTENLMSPTMEGLQDLGRPAIPPKPVHLQSWPIQRSRSLPRLPVPTTISIHTQSKDHAS